MVLTPWGMLQSQKHRDEVGSVPEDFLGKGSPSARSAPPLTPPQLFLPPCSPLSSQGCPDSSSTAPHLLLTISATPGATVIFVFIAELI